MFERRKQPVSTSQQDFTRSTANCGGGWGGGGATLPVSGVLVSSGSQGGSRTCALKEPLQVHETGSLAESGLSCETKTLNFLEVMRDWIVQPPSNNGHSAFAVNNRRVWRRMGALCRVLTSRPHLCLTQLLALPAVKVVAGWKFKPLDVF